MMKDQINVDVTRFKELFLKYFRAGVNNEIKNVGVESSISGFGAKVAYQFTYKGKEFSLVVYESHTKCQVKLFLGWDFLLYFKRAKKVRRGSSYEFPVKKFSEKSTLQNRPYVLALNFKVIPKEEQWAYTQVPLHHPDYRIITEAVRMIETLFLETKKKIS